jgi:hypothetical protein
VSTVGVRSNTDDVLHSGREFEGAAIRSARGGQHQADRDLAGAMRRQRDRAAVEHIDQRATAQGAQILECERFIVGGIGDDWRRVRRGRQHQRVVGRDARFGPSDE